MSLSHEAAEPRAPLTRPVMVWVGLVQVRKVFDEVLLLSAFFIHICIWVRMPVYIYTHSKLTTARNAKTEPKLARPKSCELRKGDTRLGQDDTHPSPTPTLQSTCPFSNIDYKREVSTQESSMASRPQTALMQEQTQRRADTQTHIRTQKQTIKQTHYFRCRRRCGRGCKP